MPPPGEPGAVPPPPPTPGQQYPPTQQMPPQYPPAQQYPPTQQMPPQYPPAQQYPPTQQMPPQYAPTQGYPPAGYGAPGAPAAPPAKKKTGLIVGGGLAAAALVAGGVVLFTGGDDDPAVTGASTTAPVVAISTTLPGASTTLGTTPSSVVLTLPEDTDPIVVDPTSPPNTDGGSDLVEVSDDLDAFSVLVPGNLELDTAPLTSSDGITIASVIAAESVNGFLNDHTTLGFQFYAARSADSVDAASLLSAISPGEGECTSSQPNIGFPTAFGGASMVTYDGCGSDSAGGKVLITVEVPDRGAVIGLYLQFIGPSDEWVETAKLALETMRPA